MVSRRKLLNAQLIAIDLWNNSLANSPAPTEDGGAGLSMLRIDTSGRPVLAEFEELSCGN